MLLATDPLLDQVKTAVSIVASLGGSLILLLPGWVLTTVYNRGVRGPDLPERAFVTQTAFGGVVVHLILFPWTLYLIQHDLGEPLAHWVEFLVWTAVALIALPAVLGVVLAGVADHVSQLQPGLRRSVLIKLGISSVVRTPYAWTWALRSLERERFVRVKLKTGAYVAGRLGTQSVAGSDPLKRDIFLEDLWNTDSDGWFESARTNTVGVWISGDDISAVEFYKPMDETVEEQLERPRARGGVRKAVAGIATFVRPAAKESEASARRAEAAADLARDEAARAARAVAELEARLAELSDRKADLPVEAAPEVPLGLDRATRDGKRAEPERAEAERAEAERAEAERAEAERAEAEQAEAEQAEAEQAEAEQAEAEQAEAEQADPT